MDCFFIDSGWWTGTHTPAMSNFRQSLLPHSSPDCWGYKWLWLNWQFHSCCMVGWLSQSWLVTASFLGKHSIYHSTLIWTVKHGMLVMVLMAGYWKSLATMGLTLGAKFCLYHALGPWNWRHKHSKLDVYICLFTSSVSQAWGYEEIFMGYLNPYRWQEQNKCNQRTLWKGNSIERTL